MMTLSKHISSSVVSLGLILSMVVHSAFANEVNKEKVEAALKGMCDKFHQCTLQVMQADGEGMPKSMLDMFAQQAQMQCKLLMNTEQIDHADKKLVKKGMTCLEDMANTSCESLMSGMQPESCIEFKRYESQR